MTTTERPTTPTTAPDGQRDDEILLMAAAVFTIAVLIHGADHVRRGADGISRDVFWLGTAAIGLEIAVVVLITQRYRLAPLVAAGAGWSLTAGYLVVHFLPGRTWLSDSFTSRADVSPLSWAAASIEVAAAATLGTAGVIVLRRRGGLVSATEPHAAQRSLRRGVLHPVALAMILGNAVILAISLRQVAG